MTSRERAIECFKELKQNGDLNLSDGMMPENPQIILRIIDSIELHMLRRVEDVIKTLDEES